MIVVDLGCAPHEGDRSIEPLVARYQPTTICGFDPDYDGEPFFAIGDTICCFYDMAAWTYDGEIDLAWGARNRLYDTIVPDNQFEGVWQRVRKVPCFDFATWLEQHPAPTVVKMNIEGAEYALMEHVFDRGADEHVVEWLIQWHDDKMPPEYAERRAAIEARARAPILPWGPAEIESVA